MVLKKGLMKKRKRVMRRKPRSNKARILKKAVGLTSQGRPPKDRQLTEVKIYDNAIATSTLDNVGQVLCINAMAQQVYNTTRIGNRIHMKYVDIKYTISSKQVVNNVNAMFRLLIVYDRESNGSIAPLTNGGVYNSAGTNGLLDTVVSTGAGNVNCLEQYYFINKARYVIVYDEAFPLVPKEAGVALLINQTIYKSVRLPLNTYTEYSTGSAGFANIAEGALLVCAMTDQAPGGGTNVAALTLNSRVFFTDN